MDRKEEWDGDDGLTRTVRDCEAIRKHLIGNKEKEEERKWTVHGQSFGGFCAVTYLSF